MKRVLAVLSLVGVMVVPVSAVAQSPNPSPVSSDVPTPIASSAPSYTRLLDFLTSVLPIVQDVSNSAGLNDLQGHAGDIAANYVAVLLTVTPAPCYQDFYVKNWTLAALLGALADAPRKDKAVAFDLVNRAMSEVAGSLPTGTACV